MQNNLLGQTILFLLLDIVSVLVYVFLLFYNWLSRHRKRQPRRRPI